MNPWLQRFLVSWAAGVAASGVVISTAKKPGRLKKKKRKKKADGTEEPVQMGAVALRDARAPEERGLTVGEWREHVVTTTRGVGTKVAALFRREPSAAAADDGSPREPDEVQAADGTRLKTAPRAARKKNKKKQRKGGHAKGSAGKRGRRGRRPQATLWDSAKESLKQTVKETVKEEVKATPVGTAFEALKNVGAKVKEGATTAASAAASAVGKVMADTKQGGVRDEIPPQLRGEPPGAPSEVNEPPPPSVTPQKVEETLEAIGRSIETAIHKVADGARAAAEDVKKASEAGEAGEPRGDGAPVDVGEVAKKVRGGVDAVGSWLQGPGAPGYRRRVRPASGGDVVEAKDAPLKDAPKDVVEARDAPSAPAAAPSTPPATHGPDGGAGEAAGEIAPAPSDAAPDPAAAPAPDPAAAPAPDASPSAAGHDDDEGKAAE